jgi:hypothetical protein
MGSIALLAISHTFMAISKILSFFYCNELLLFGDAIVSGVPY